MVVEILYERNREGNEWNSKVYAIIFTLTGISLSCRFT